MFTVLNVHWNNLSLSSPASSHLTSETSLFELAEAFIADVKGPSYNHDDPNRLACIIGTSEIENAPENYHRACSLQLEMRRLKTEDITALANWRKFWSWSTSCHSKAKINCSWMAELLWGNCSYQRCTFTLISWWYWCGVVLEGGFVENVSGRSGWKCLLAVESAWNFGMMYASYELRSFLRAIVVPSMAGRMPIFLPFGQRGIDGS